MKNIFSQLRGRGISATASAYAVVGGALSLLGWITGGGQLTDWWNTGITIKANTAIAAMGVGSALLVMLFAPRLRLLRHVLIAIPLALAVLTLVEHAANIDLGIDTLLFDEAPGSPATSAPGRMGIPASVSFTALGIAILLLPRSGRSYRLSIGLGITVLGISILSLVGYGFGATAMYTLPRLTGIAAQSATMLLALAIGVVTARPTRDPVRILSEDSNAGMLARVLLPVVFVVPVLLGSLRLLGSRHGLYGPEFGAALRTLAEIAVLGVVSWWSVQAIRVRDLRQQRTEQRQQVSEQRLLSTLESMSDGFLTFDQQWHFTYINAEAERLLRKSRSELLGTIIWEQFPAIRETALEAEYLRAASEQQMRDFEGFGFDTDGERYFRHRLYPVPGGGTSVYMQDVTTRKRAEDALREADRRKDEFLATLAHELRNPLAPIRNAATLLSLGDVSEATLRMCAEIVNRQVQHMARLLEDLLDISRISRSRLELQREPLDLRRVLDASAETSAPLLNAANHTLHWQAPPTPLYVDGDSVRLTQVFSNLLNNAAKFTEPGGHIRIAIDSDSQWIVVRVVDSGLGIDADALPHIFDMFTQATPERNQARSGLGIGLSLARGIVELHGGAIDACSQGSGAGSEFRVRLPRLQPAQIPQDSPAFVPAPAVSRLRILVADDLVDNADSLAAMLSRLGHEVAVAYDGARALECARALRPDVAVLDIGMPMLSGLDVCAQLRASGLRSHAGHAPLLVAVTGWGQDEDRERTRAAGFDAHLTKPVNARELFELLATRAPTPT